MVSECWIGNERSDLPAAPSAVCSGCPGVRRNISAVTLVSPKLLPGDAEGRWRKDFMFEVFGFFLRFRLFLFAFPAGPAPLLGLRAVPFDFAFAPPLALP